MHGTVDDTPPPARPPDAMLLRSPGSRQQYYEQAAAYLLRDGAGHWACRHAGIVRELLWLWQFSGQSSVQFLQNSLKDQVAGCLQCAISLQGARQSALEAGACTPGLRDAIRAWDVARLTAKFEQFREGETTQGHEDRRRSLQATLCSHVDFLLQPSLLLLDDTAGERLNAAFSASLATMVQGDLCISAPQQLPGLYLLCVHAHGAIRSWARVQVRASVKLEQTSEFQVLHEAFDLLVQHCERLTLIRNGCGEEGDGPVSLPQALSDDEREAWTGLVVAIQQLSPWIVRDLLVPRYCGLLPLALMCLAEGDCAAMLPAATVIKHVMQCLGHAFWHLSTCSFSPATLRRLLSTLATTSTAAIPVRQTCLELLEAVALTASRVEETIADDVASFLSSRELRSGPAAHTAVTLMATRVLARILQRLADRGLAALAIKSCALWSPHVVGTACSPNLPELSRAPATNVLVTIVEQQTGRLEKALICRDSQQPSEGNPGCAEEPWHKDASDDRSGALGDSDMWLESMWAWLLLRAGTDTIPPQVHVALLKAACSLLVWPVDEGVRSSKDASVGILHRFTTLMVGYLQSLARMGGVVSWLVSGACKAQVEELLFALALIRHPDARAAIRQLSFAAMGLHGDNEDGKGVVRALHALACRSPAALAAGIHAALGQARRMGLDGVAFPLLHNLFLFVGQLVPLLIDRRLLIARDQAGACADKQEELLLALWDLMQDFIKCRTQLRKPHVMKRHGDSALDATACTFFNCFQELWPHFAPMVLTQDPGCGDSFDLHLRESIACAHGRWLPLFAKWGGIASLTVRRHWSSCMVTILATLTRLQQTLDSKEKVIMDKLVERRDLWTDGQYLALCSALRPLGAEKVKGNLGLHALANLPDSRTTSSSRVLGDARDSEGGNIAHESQRGGEHRADTATHGARGMPSAARSRRSSDQPGTGAQLHRGKRKSKFACGEVDDLDDGSSEENEKEEVAPEGTTKEKKRNRKPESVFDILQDIRGGSAQKEISMTMGGQRVHTSADGAERQGCDAAVKVSRRQERSTEELRDAFLGEVLSWDLRLQSRPGQSCGKVPLTFDSLDQYEDVFGALLLEETWEQLANALEEEIAQVEDEKADFHAMQVLNYDEMGDFAIADVRTNTDSAVAAGRGDCGLNEMDLILLVSPDPYQGKGDRLGHDIGDDGGRNGWHARQEGPPTQKIPRQVEHVLGLIDAPQQGDQQGVARVRVLTRRTPRNKRFAHRLAQRASICNPRQGAVPSDNDSELRMVVLNHSLSTAAREFVALHRVRALDAATQRAVLNPQLAQPRALATARKGTRAVVPPDTLNEDQLAAVEACLEPGPVFALMQGPPGTGKTSTLCGLITALLAWPSGCMHDGRRVLVCAPSNAAVDELAARVAQGLAVQGRSERYRPRVVRVGAKRQMRRDVWEDVSLEQQVSRRLAQLDDEQLAVKAQLAALTKEVESLTARLEACAQKGSGLAGLEAEGAEEKNMLVSERKQKLALCAQRAAAAALSETRRGVLKRQLRGELLGKAQIVCATLSGAGSDLLQKSGSSFDAVIVDEAAQALEPAALIPLQLHSERCILVGDPQQLPATVTSHKAGRNLYARSLFERLQAAGLRASMLSVQYRMHPAIRAFPSTHFYGGKLSDCLGEDGRRAPWHVDIRFSPLVFYDIAGDEGAKRAGSNSRCNPAESRTCAALISALARRLPGGSLGISQRVAVMSPYRRQCAEIRQQLSAAGLGDVPVSSVDAFQGRETDIIVLSCVRSGLGGLGFVGDVRRLNVALTRARCSLIIIGDAGTLAQNDHWAALIAHAHAQKCCVQLSVAALPSVFGGAEDDRWCLGAWPQSMLRPRPNLSAAE